MPCKRMQSCVHIAGLLLSLAKVTQTACTSQVCVWSTLGISGKAQLTTEIDFGEANSTGYNHIVEHYSIHQY